MWLIWSSSSFFAIFKVINENAEGNEGHLVIMTGLVQWLSLTLYLAHFILMHFHQACTRLHLKSHFDLISYFVC